MNDPAHTGAIDDVTVGFPRQHVTRGLDFSNGQLPIRAIVAALDALEV